MNRTTLTIVTIVISLASFALGHVTADPVEVKTVEREKVVHAKFEYEVGDKVHCELSTEIKPCEIVAKKSNGSYAIKYTHTGIAGGEKVILMDADNILK